MATTLIMKTPQFIQHIRDLISKGDLPTALLQVRELLENSPKLDEAILQSARLQTIREQIRLGTVNFEEANVTRNQITVGLLDLLREIETVQKTIPYIREEVTKAVSIVHSKNVISGSTVSAGRDVVTGDKTEVHHHYGDRKIPHALTAPPFLPEVFLGREEDLRGVHDQLFSGDNLLLLVNGIGGVGKTTLASKYYHTYQQEYTHVAWVLSEKSIANALLQLAPHLGLQFDAQMDTAQRLQLLLTALADLKKPGLLVIDNANELDDLQANYQLLRRCSNFHLLLTSRISEFRQAETYGIAGLPKADALELFIKYYPKFLRTEKEHFFQLHTAVGGNTLVIELLAKNLALFNRLKTHYSLDDLLRDLQQKGLLQLSHSKEVSTDYHGERAMRTEKPEAIIAAMYKLSELLPEETALLSVFAVLPAESIAYEMLEKLLPERSEALEIPLLALAQKGWIEYNEHTAAFKCSPVIQEIVRHKNPSLRTDCHPLIDTLNEKLKYEGGIGHLTNATYEEAVLYARYAESVVMGFAEPSESKMILCERIGNYHYTTGNLNQATILYEKYNQIAQALFTSNPDDSSYKNGLAISYSKLGETHTSLGNLDQALTFFKERSRLGKELYEAYPQNVSFKNGLAISYSQLGRFYRDQKENSEKAKAYFQLCYGLWKELAETFPAYVQFRDYFKWADKALEGL